MTDSLNEQLDYPDSPHVSRPLPRVQIEYPSRERGADGVREHLDAPRCALCGCPDVDLVLADVFGAMMRRPICRGHSEHPEHHRYTGGDNPVDLRRCLGCDEFYRERWGAKPWCLECFLDRRNWAREALPDELNRPQMAGVR